MKFSIIFNKCVLSYIVIKWHDVEIKKKTLEKTEGRWVKADKAKS